MNLLFPGVGHLYAGAGRRAIGYLVAAVGAQVLRSQGESHRVLTLDVAGTLVWLAAFILSIGSVLKAVDARDWRPSGRNTRPFAIAFAVFSAVVSIALAANPTP